MRTRTFKTLRGWLDYISRHHKRTGEEVYEPLDEFFRDQVHVMYFTGFGTANEKWHDDYVSLPWEQKLPIAQKIVDFHWRNRTKGERAKIAERLAKGDGDLSFLQSFQVSIQKEDGKWSFQYCTSSLSGPNYDWCKRKWLQSL